MRPSWDPHADSATCVLKLKGLSYPAHSIDIMLNILFILSALSANFAGGTCDEPKRIISRMSCHSGEPSPSARPLPMTNTFYRYR